MTAPAIQIDQLHFGYPHSGFALSIESMQVRPREHVAIVGPSGCGKTTLLHLTAGILGAKPGMLRVLGQDLGLLSPRGRRRFRIARIGLVFQEFELIEYLNVEENILLPYRIDRHLKLDQETRRRAAELAGLVGLENKLKRNVNRLSQGERQRAAICRALITNPDLVLADEPTGNLDPTNKQRIVDLLVEHARRSEASLLVVTHDHSLLGDFERVVEIDQLSPVSVTSPSGT